MVKKFQRKNGRQRNATALHGEGGESNKEDPVLLAKLEALYNLVSKYDQSYTIWIR